MCGCLRLKHELQQHLVDPAKLNNLNKKKNHLLFHAEESRITKRE